MKRRKGFSFVEVIVVIAILAVIAIILIPALLQYNERSSAQKDASSGSEIVRAVQLAIAEDDIFDEVFHYSIKNNFITYTDSDGSYGVTVTDNEYWAPDGSGKATTITFNPTHENNKTYYDIANGYVNDMTYQNGSVVNPARVMIGCEAYAAQCRLSEMTKDDVHVSALLYNKVRSVVGERVEVTSATYRNSSYTVFIRFVLKDGFYIAEVDGKFNGTNLDGDSQSSLGTGTTDYDDNGTPNQQNPGGTTSAMFDNTDMTGGGHVTYRTYPTFTEDSLDKAKWLAFCQSLDGNAYKTLQISTLAHEGGTDVSTSGNGSIVAWTDGDGVYVGYKDGGKMILLPEDSSNLFDADSTGFHNLIGINVNKGDTSNVKNASRMLANNKKAENIDIGGWTMSQATNYSYMFYDCNKVKSLRVNQFNLDNATTISYMFAGCNIVGALEIQAWNTTNVIDMSYAFAGCTTISTLSTTTMRTPNVTNMAHTFEGMTSLRSLDLSKWDVSGVTNFDSMFKDCTALENINLSEWSTASALSMASMFENCRQLEEVDASTFVTNRVTDFSQMFYKCTELSVLNIENFDTTHANDMLKMFDNMVRLQEVTIGSMFTFRGNGSTRCFLPEPSEVYIDGATGTWMDDVGGSYHPDEIPNRVAATYYAIDTSSLAVFAPSNSWWRGTTPKTTIQRIIITNTYKGTAWSERFNADADNEGAIEVYIEGNVAYIVNNRNRRSKAAFQLSSDASATFADFTNLKSITGLKLLNTINVTNMNNFFGRVSGDTVTGCTQLTYAPGIEDWNTQNVQTAKYAFAGIGVSSINLSNWQIFNARDLSGMFQGSKASIINLSGWDVRSVSNFDNMFKNCTSLGSVALTSWKPSQSAQLQGMFDGCTALSTIMASDTFNPNTKTINMFNGCTSIVGTLGTTYIDATSKYAHLDADGNPGYFSTDQQTGTFSAKLYTSGSASGVYTELTYAGATAQDWDYRNGSRLLEIKLYELPKNKENIVTVTVPAGMYIENNSWSTVNDDIKSVTFTVLDVNPTQSGTQQGTGTYFNPQTGTLTFTLQPYVTTTTLTCRVMYDEVLWDKCRGTLSTTSYYTLNTDKTDIVPEDAIVIKLDNTVTRKLSHVKAAQSVGAASNGWGYAWSIWQQSTIQYITEPSQPAKGYAHNGNYFDSVDRSSRTYYFKDIKYTVWATSTNSSGKTIRAKIAAVNQVNTYYTDITPVSTWYYVDPTTGSRVTSSAGTANEYVREWHDVYGASFGFPNVNLKLEAQDGFQAGKTLVYHYQVEFTTYSGRKVTIVRTMSSSIKNATVDYTLFTVSGNNITTPTESYYKGNNIVGYCGTFFGQNACIEAIPNIDMEVIFDAMTLSGAPKLKVQAYRALSMNRQTYTYRITLINDAGQTFGPYFADIKADTSDAYGAYISAEKIATANGLSGKYYLKQINYTIPSVAGSAMKTYLSLSGSNYHQLCGGSIWGTATATTASTLKYTCGGMTRTATVQTRVLTPDGSNTDFSAYVSSYANPLGNSVQAGDDFELDLQLAAHSYQNVYSASRAVSNALSRPVVYVILPVGVNVEGVIIGDSRTAVVTKCTPSVVRIKSVEVDGVLSYIYKISFAEDDWFGYNVAGLSAIGGMPITSQWLRLMCSTDTSMPQTTFNIRNCVYFTDENGRIYLYSSYGGPNYVTDIYDVDNDGVTNEGFASIASAAYITINER